MPSPLRLRTKRRTVATIVLVALLLAVLSTADRFFALGNDDISLPPSPALTAEAFTSRPPSLHKTSPPAHEVKLDALLDMASSVLESAGDGSFVYEPADRPYVDLTATDLAMPEASNPGGQDLADACVGCVAPFPNSRLADLTWSGNVPWFTGRGGGLQRGWGEGGLLGIAGGFSRVGGGVVDPVHDEHSSDRGNPRGNPNDDSPSDSTQTSVDHGQSTPPSNPPNDPGPNPPPHEPPQPPGDGPRAPQSVPEPATLLLTALGAGGLIARRMRARS